MTLESSKYMLQVGTSSLIHTKRSEILFWTVQLKTDKNIILLILLVHSLMGVVQNNRPNFNTSLHWNLYFYFSQVSKRIYNLYYVLFKHEEIQI
jgi:hypothetical protein